MVTTAKSVLYEHTIKNLLSAQKRIADTGDARSIIRISRYLLNIAKEIGDITVDTGSDSDEYGRCDPINHL